jgi:uncharacterized membrane protein
MAGIGFELRKILNEDSLGAIGRAHVLGGIIVLGPFLCSVLCLAGLNVFSARFTQGDFTVRQVFASAVVYTFGGSLIATGPLQVVLTRYLADKVYRGEYDSLIECLFPAMMITAAILCVPALPVVLHVDLSITAKLTLIALHSTIGCMWMVVVFVRAAHGHRAVAIIFLVGSAAALGLGLLLVGYLGLEGLLIGYTVGHTLLLVLLIRQLFYEFGHPRRWDWRVFTYVKLFPMLLAIGLLQNLGIWIDKILFWGSDLQLAIKGFLTAPKYDSSTFLAFLTALPAFVVFFVRVETDFHDQFHGYFDEIFFRGPYERIAACARSLRETLRDALLDILKVQALVSLLALFFAMEILQLVGLPLSQLGMFRFGIVASFFFSFMMFANVILLYLDRQAEALLSTLVFFVSNLVLTELTIGLGYAFYGVGLATSCFLGMITALFHLANQLHNLEFMTFGTMPVMGSMRAKRTLLARPDGMYGVVQPLQVGEGRTPK